MIEELKKLGLTEYEAKAYMALLREGPSKGSVISKKSKVPQGKIYETLMKLMDKGLVAETPTKPKQFKALKPEHAFHRWIDEKRHDFDSLSKKIISDLKDIKHFKPEERVRELVSFVEGRENVFNLGTVMFNKAQKEILLISVGERVTYPLLRAWKGAAERGIDCKFIATKWDKENEHILKEYIDIGIKMRHRKMQGFSIAVVDKNESMISVRRPEYPKIKDMVCVHITSPDLSKSLAEYFESVWRRSKPVILKKK
jgi:sugar-specific transcriptional regulator TrmB